MRQKHGVRLTVGKEGSPSCRPDSLGEHTTNAVEHGHVREPLNKAINGAFVAKQQWAVDVPGRRAARERDSLELVGDALRRARRNRSRRWRRRWVDVLMRGRERNPWHVIAAGSDRLDRRAARGQADQRQTHECAPGSTHFQL